jgi:aspartyl/asparaginyl-tRNA synthetase
MDWQASWIVFPQSLGCETYVKHLMSDKLTPKSDKCFFVGYPRETKGYYFYNKDEGKVFIAHNDVFMEKEFLSVGDRLPDAYELQ